MSIEKDYYSADTVEIGRLSQKALDGDHGSKERMFLLLVCPSISPKMNLIKMAELTQSCPNLQVFSILLP